MASSLIDTIEAAMLELHETEIAVAEDMGEETVEAAYGDLVHAVMACCTPEVAAELERRTLSL